MVAGRPKAQIDEKKLRELANCQCTDLEIAATLGINVDTLHDNFSEKVAYYRAEGLAVLRCTQWHKAIVSKDCAMLRHLGKVYLGQKDEIALTTNEPSVRQLLNKWEGGGSKINPANVVVKPESPPDKIVNFPSSSNNP